MTDEYDVIIIGLGAMGSAAAHHLTKVGQRVLGLDRFQPPHHFGSSHGMNSNSNPGGNSCSRSAVS
jgi:sarcosine oxidase